LFSCRKFYMKWKFEILVEFWVYLQSGKLGSGLSHDRLWNP
jgi:hypothetical protein